jgi:putative transposase
MAARGWSKAQAGRRFLVTDDTVASWSGRLEEDEPGALVNATVPVNKFPDFVAAMVAKLKRLFPAMGRRRIGAFLARAGLHIAPTTVRRMLNRKPAAEPPAPVAPAEPLSSAKPRTVIANYPNHVWGVDTTAVPTSTGFWASWFPFSLAQSWPFCWWVAVVIDHWSRRSLGLASFKRRPTADEICIVLDEAARRAGRVPKYTVSDQGSEFGEEYLEWCDDHDVGARFGAVGRHGSIAVEERFIRTLKEEGLAHEFVPLRHTAFCASLARLEDWYNEARPHSSMGGATPDEVFHGRHPANRRRRFEPRARYPAKGACAAPWAPARAKIGARLELVATPFRSARHLAQVEIRRGD